MDKATATGTRARLKGRRVAILATDGFEQSELVEPRRALDEAGASSVLIAPKAGSITDGATVHGARVLPSTRRSTRPTPVTTTR